MDNARIGGWLSDNSGYQSDTRPISDSDHTLVRFRENERSLETAEVQPV